MPPRRTSFRPGRSAWAVLAVSLLLTAGASFYVMRTSDAKDRLRFQNRTERLADALSDGMDTYVALLRGVAGFYAADPDASRQAFFKYVERLDPLRRYPGLRGIGFALRSTPGEDEPLAALMRDQGDPTFHVWPPTPFAERFVITQLEPLDDLNRAALGFDMFTDPARRAAMVRARDTGQPTASARVLLRREIDPQQQPGFLLYVPIYKTVMPPETVAGRKAELLGFAYSPFRFGTLLEGLLGDGSHRDVEFAIRDGPAGTGTLLHDWQTPPASRGRMGWLTGTRPVEVGGRTWTVEFAALPSFEGGSAGGLVWQAMFAGVGISLLMFTTVWVLERARSRAERVATELRRSEGELRVSESRFRRLLEANVVGICIINLDGRVMEGNDAIFQIFGRPREEVVGGPVRWGDLTAPDFHPADAAAVEELRSVGRCTPFEKEYAHPDGQRVTVLAAAAMLEGSTDECIAFNLDITEWKRAERELAHAKEAAEAANRAKDRFLAILSHELRGPLAPVLALAGLNADDPAVPDEQREDWATVARNVEWEARLVEDLLDVTRIGRGKMAFHRSRLDLHEVLRTAAEGVRAGGAAKKRQRVEVDLRAERHQVVGDAGRLGQLFANLLGNASKFTPDGGRIGLRSRDVGGGVVRVEVSDDGIGIEPDVLPRIFQPFEQGEGETNRVYGGLGLGLAIVRGIVEAHAGRIRASSDGRGKGATFTIDLHAAEAEARPAGTNGSNGSAGRRSRRAGGAVTSDAGG